MSSTRADRGYFRRLPLRIAAERATLNGMKFSVFWGGVKHGVRAHLHRKPDCEGHVFVWTQEPPPLGAPPPTARMSEHPPFTIRGL
jgi:hypothetical protein